jgi:hypothetical protein
MIAECVSGDTQFRSIRRIVEKRRLLRSRIRIAALVIVCILVSILITGLLEQQGRSAKEISYVDTTLESVATDLNDQFGIRVIAHETLLGCKFTGTIYTDDGIEAIGIVSDALNLQLNEIAERTYLLKGEGCAAKVH